MTTYEVREATKVKDHNGVSIYKLALWANGEVHEAELFDNQKLNPAVGQQIQGDIEQTQYGPKIKVLRKGGFGGGGGGRRPSDPKERASIEMQSSIRSAVELTVGLAQADKLPADFASTEKLTTAVLGIARAFYGATQQAAKEAPSG